MLISYYPGNAACSEYSANRLVDSLRQLVPEVESLSADFVHVVLFQREPGVSESATLSSLLDYGEARVVGMLYKLEYYVAPRPGTISPWSS